MSRANLFFSALDLVEGFEPVAGSVAGITQKVLSSDLDVPAAQGSRSRLLRLAPGTRTPAAHAHPYHEELYVLEGEMSIDDGAAGHKRVTAPAYAIRSPGVMHGPVHSEAGCLLLEFSWFGTVSHDRARALGDTDD